MTAAEPLPPLRSNAHSFGKTALRGLTWSQQSCEQNNKQTNCVSKLSESWISDEAEKKKEGKRQTPTDGRKDGHTHTHTDTHTHTQFRNFVEISKVRATFSHLLRNIGEITDDSNDISFPRSFETAKFRTNGRTEEQPQKWTDERINS